MLKDPKSAAGRGKGAEALLKKHLESLNKSSAYAYHRLADARAGSLQATLADFLLMRQGRLHLIEVKETKHDFRLPHGNFKVEQVARQRIWQDAGAVSLVLIYHSTLNRWRGYNIDRFTTREGGSWDLRDTAPSTLLDLLT